MASRLVRLYGTRAARHARQAPRAAADLGEHFGAGLTQREVDYLIDHEWARTAEDILWRRTKLGLRVGERDDKALDGLSRTGRESGNAKKG